MHDRLIIIFHSMKISPCWLPIARCPSRLRRWLSRLYRTLRPRGTCLPWKIHRIFTRFRRIGCPSRRTSHCAKTLHIIYGLLIWRVSQLRSALRLWTGLNTSCRLPTRKCPSRFSFLSWIRLRTSLTTFLSTGINRGHPSCRIWILPCNSPHWRNTIRPCPLAVRFWTIRKWSSGSSCSSIGLFRGVCRSWSPRCKWCPGFRRIWGRWTGVPWLIRVGRRSWRWEVPSGGFPCCEATCRWSRLRRKGHPGKTESFRP